MPEHFLKLSDFSSNRLRKLVTTAGVMKGKRELNRITGARLSGLCTALIFEKPSTRTRCSFQLGMAEEGGQSHVLTPDTIHMGAKESLRDTARVLSRFYSAIAWRGHEDGQLLQLAEYASVPVINMLSQLHHPTQALADVMTLQEEFGHIDELRVTYLGDTQNNVARSLAEAAELFQFTLILSGPEDQLNKIPQNLRIPESKHVHYASDPVQAVKGSHALYTDVWTSMGEKQDAARQEWNLFGRYQVNAELMHATGRDDTIFLHCLPAVREKEVTDEVMESNCSRVFDQAENRLHTIKALLVELLA